MNLVELELDETLADFEVQDWIDNIFSVQFPDIKANIKKGCNSLCQKEDWKYPSKGELPKCDEKSQLMFYVNCYYKIGNETVKRKRMVLGYFQKSFLNEDVKLFVERSKGYEDEHLPKDVIAWKEIMLPKEAK